MRKGDFPGLWTYYSRAKEENSRLKLSDMVAVWASIPHAARRITVRYLDPLDTLSRGRGCSLLLVYIPYNEAGILGYAV